MFFASSTACVCVGSNDQWDGNPCCPGFDGRLRRPSSCPNADDNFDGCETNFKQYRRDDLVTLISPRKLHLSVRSELITDILQITLHFFVTAWINEELHYTFGPVENYLCNFHVSQGRSKRPHTSNWHKVFTDIPKIRTAMFGSHESCSSSVQESPGSERRPQSSSTEVGRCYDSGSKSSQWRDRISFVASLRCRGAGSLLFNEVEGAVANAVHGRCGLNEGERFLSFSVSQFRLCIRAGSRARPRLNGCHLISKLPNEKARLRQSLQKFVQPHQKPGTALYRNFPRIHSRLWRLSPTVRQLSRNCLFYRPTGWNINSFDLSFTDENSYADPNPEISVIFLQKYLANRAEGLDLVFWWLHLHKVHLQLTWRCRHELQLLLQPSVPGRGGCSSSSSSSSSRSAILTYSICIALVTSLLTVLTKLIWTKCLKTHTHRDKCLSWQRRDVMFALNLAPLHKTHQSRTFCQQKKDYFHVSALVSSPAVSARPPFVGVVAMFVCVFSLSFRPTNSVCHLVSGAHVSVNSDTSHTACTDAHTLSACHIALIPCTTFVAQG